MQVDHPIKKQIREMIANKVILWKVSQKEAGKRLGISQARVSQILTGTSVMSIEKLLAVADKAGIKCSVRFES